MSEVQKRSAEVKIMGQRYSIRSSYDEEFIKKTAELVNQKMAEIKQGASIVSTEKVAILASLTLASELLTAKEENIQLKRRVTKRLNTILQTLDACLGEQVTSAENSEQMNSPLPCA